MVKEEIPHHIIWGKSHIGYQHRIFTKSELEYTGAKNHEYVEKI
jgi:hypothetical protein